MSTPGVKDLISMIRQQLEELDQERRDARAPALLKLDTVELEINFTVEETATKTGGVDLKVVSFGGDKQVKTEQVHKVTVKLSVAPEAEGRLGSRYHHGVVSPIE
jgi:hypothetical protein